MANDNEWEGGAHMESRRAMAEEFYESILDDVGAPLFVSDEATVWEVWDGDADEIVDRCRRHYGVELGRETLGLPFWRLLDHLAASRL